jgi:hypothetical protein
VEDSGLREHVQGLKKADKEEFFKWFLSLNYLPGLPEVPGWPLNQGKDTVEAAQQIWMGIYSGADVPRLKPAEECAGWEKKLRLFSPLAPTNIQETESVDVDSLIDMAERTLSRGVGVEAAVGDLVAPVVKKICRMPKARWRQDGSLATI